MRTMGLLVVWLGCGCGAALSPEADAGSSVDAGVLEPDAGMTARACSGTVSCPALTENQCTALTAADAGCSVRRTPRCVERGTCAGQQQSTCAAAGACRWNGSGCVTEACAAQTTEPDCLALRCAWATLYSGCNGTSASCDVAARALDGANPAQACTALVSLGLSCAP